MRMQLFGAAVVSAIVAFLPAANAVQLEISASIEQHDIDDALMLA